VMPVTMGDKVASSSEAYATGCFRCDSTASLDNMGSKFPCDWRLPCTLNCQMKIKCGLFLKST
jgi:hypothetical protein